MSKLLRLLLFYLSVIMVAPVLATNNRVLMLSKEVSGTTYKIYKQIIDENDVHVNPDNWKCYRSSLTLDITKNNNTQTYTIDDNIYLDREDSHHGGQRPCLLLDFDANQLFVFINSKDAENQYSMDGNAYHSSLTNISFTLEKVFTYANWGWSPYFTEASNGQLKLRHFSFAGYYGIYSVRSSNGEWSIESAENISPDDFEAQSQEAGNVLVVGTQTTDPDTPVSITDISTLDNVVYIDPVTAEVGTEVTLSVKMKNKVQAEGFGFDLYLPDGITFKLDEDGFPEAYLSTKRTTARKTNTFESAIQANGSLRVFAASTNGSVISGNDGEVALVTIIISSEMAAGTYPLLLKEIAISDVDANSLDTELVETSITITDPASVTSITDNDPDNAPFYNLEGQQLQNPSSKGVYIHNGKKHVKK